MKELAILRTLEYKKNKITKELVSLHYFFMFQMLKEKKITRLQNYHDWFYSFSGNCLNATIVDNTRFLLQNIEGFSLKNKHLLRRAKTLYDFALTIKDENDELKPIHRGIPANQELAKMFSGKLRKQWEKQWNRR